MTILILHDDYVSVVEQFGYLYFKHCTLEAMYVDHNVELYIVRFIGGEARDDKLHVCAFCT